MVCIKTVMHIMYNPVVRTPRRRHEHSDEFKRELVEDLDSIVAHRAAISPRSKSTNSSRVVMLIRLATLCSRWPIQRVASYVRQQVSLGSNSDESMRRAERPDVATDIPGPIRNGA
ncbi:hypothetical protein BH11PSE8_BH11PSE8_18950 [soil metagenome]